MFWVWREREVPSSNNTVHRHVRSLFQVQNAEELEADGPIASRDQENESKCAGGAWIARPASSPWLIYNTAATLNGRDEGSYTYTLIP